MQRPCTCDRINQDGSYSLEDCRLCWLFRFDPRYRKLWGGESIQQPSLLQRAGSFLRSSANYVIRGMPQVSEEEYQRRVNICQACEFYRDENCLKCGCRLLGKIVAKCRWATETCPVGKW